METVIEKIVVLRLSYKEAMWLKGYVQNAHFKDEDPESAEMREVLFNALPPFSS